MNVLDMYFDLISNEIDNVSFNSDLIDDDELIYLMWEEEEDAF